MAVNIPDRKVHGANIGLTWVLSAPNGPHVGPTNLAVRDVNKDLCQVILQLRHRQAREWYVAYLMQSIFITMNIFSQSGVWSAISGANLEHKMNWFINDCISVRWIAFRTNVRFNVGDILLIPFIYECGLLLYDMIAQWRQRIESRLIILTQSLPICFQAKIWCQILNSLRPSDAYMRQ